MAELTGQRARKPQRGVRRALSQRWAGAGARGSPVSDALFYELSGIRLAVSRIYPCEVVIECPEVLMKVHKGVALTLQVV